VIVPCFRCGLSVATQVPRKSRTYLRSYNGAASDTALTFLGPLLPTVRTLRDVLRSITQAGRDRIDVC
jgi:hypothetical protein